MFQARRALFLYCLTPVHMGAGTTIGAIDNPIQRERHTEHPIFAGSGLKGALRHHLEKAWQNGGEDLIVSIFGPSSQEAHAHAGALSLSDAALVAFPVRCTRRAFVYATSATALARARRQLALAGVADLPPAVPEPAAGKALLASAAAATDGALILESYRLEAEVNAEVEAAAGWLHKHALPPGAEYAFFRDKLASDLVVLPDEDLGFFVKNATVVEPHVRIDDASGTADDGGLFYTENLPPESLLLAVAMASVERRPKEKGGNGLDAEAVLGVVADGREGLRGIDGATLQIGGDATTGRGLVTARFLAAGGKEGS